MYDPAAVSNGEQARQSYRSGSHREAPAADPTRLPRSGLVQNTLSRVQPKTGAAPWRPWFSRQLCVREDVIAHKKYATSPLPMSDSSASNLIWINDLYIYPNQHQFCCWPRG